MTTNMTDLATGRTFVLEGTLPGRDAYELAVAAGFIGSREDWLRTLKGFEFDPANPNWLPSRDYPFRAAVLHNASLWYARVANFDVAPGTNNDVWVKLIHGEDAAALSDALAQVEEVRVAAADLAGAPEDQDLGGGTYSANHHRAKAAALRDQTATLRDGAADLLNLTIAASEALSPICALHDLAFPIPAGWWDTLDRLPPVTSLLGSVSTYAIICNLKPWGLFPGIDGALLGIASHDNAITTATDTAGLMPATWGNSVARIADSKGAGSSIGPLRNSVQANSALRGVLGRAPISRRNLLPANTQNITTGAGWFQTRISRVNALDSATGEPATTVTVTEDDVNGGFIATSDVDLAAGQHTLTAIVKGTGWIALRPTVSTNFADAAAAWFNLGTGAAGNIVLAGGSTAFTAVSGDITPVGDGYRVRITFTLGSAAKVAPRLYVVNGNAALAVTAGATFRVEAPQLEMGSQATAYQRRVSGLDVSEQGVPSFPFLRLDLVDDVIPITFPDGLSGDVLVIGRNGSWIERDVTVAAGGALNIGPRTIAGRVPGVLNALGDIVAIVPINRTMTASEIARLIAYYRPLGGVGLLTLGPELVVNGTFDADAAGWTAAVGTIAEVVNGAVRIITPDAAITSPRLIQGIPTQVGKLYLAKADKIGPTNNAGLVASTSASVGGFPGVDITSGTAQFVFAAQATTTNLIVISYSLTAGAYSEWDNISVRELTAS